MNMATENTEVPHGLRKATIESATDWNDGAQLFGLDWVRDNIMAAIERKQTPAMWMERNGRIKTTDGRIMTQAQADELGLDVAVASTEVLSNVKVQAHADMTDKKPKYEPRAYQQGDGVPDGFVVNDNGVWFMGGDATVKVCARLDVLALTRNDKSEAWGRLLQWNDADGKSHTWAMPIEIVHGVASELLRLISSQGLDVSPKSGGKLAEYIVSCKPAARATNINKTGWYNDVFVLPHQTIGQSNDTAIYQSTDGAANPYSTAGTLEQWRDNVAAVCVGNSRCVMAVSMAFAGALLPLIKMEGGGIHIVGSSSTGKSTASRLAASVYGDEKFMRQWRATDNGLEGIASLHNHGLLILDELRQAPAKSVGDAVYMLANGAGKIRAGRSGGSKASKGWELLYLSNGEIGLAQHMNEAGKATHAGQETRFAEVKADAGAGFGIFEQLHGYNGGADLSNAIKANTAQYHGVAGVAFIGQCTTNAQSLRDELTDKVNDFVKEIVPTDAQGQTQRVAARFGLIAVAGELASAWGITGWQAGAAYDAMRACFNDWLEHRESGGANQEKEQIIEAVKTFILKHADSRFTDIDDTREDKTINRAGWKRRVKCSDAMEYLFIKDVFNTEVCAGFDSRGVLKVLAAGGFIETQKDGAKKRYATLQQIGSTRTRLYVVKSLLLEA